MPITIKDFTKDQKQTTAELFVYTIKEVKKIKKKKQSVLKRKKIN